MSSTGSALATGGGSAGVVSTGLSSGTVMVSGRRAISTRSGRGGAGLGLGLTVGLRGGTGVTSGVAWGTALRGST